MTVALYFDHQVPIAIVDGVRDRGIDVLTAKEDFHEERADEDVMRRATELGRVVVTHDTDFLKLADQFQKCRREFSGVIFGHQLGLTIGQAVRDLEFLAMAGSPEDFGNRVEYIPLNRLA